MIEAICSNCGNKKEFDSSITSLTYRCPQCNAQVEFQNIDSSLGKTTVIARSVAAAPSFSPKVGDIHAPVISNPITKENRKSKDKWLIGILLAISLILLSFLAYYLFFDKKEINNTALLTETKDSASDSDTRRGSGKNSRDRKRKSSHSEFESDENESHVISDNYNNINIGVYKNIMTNYYSDLTNDNYESLLYYYNDVVDEYITPGKPKTNYSLIDAHKSYHEKYPYHIYELVSIRPKDISDYRASFYVKLRVSIKKDYYEDYKDYIINDIFTFNEYNKITSVLIIK